MDAPVFLLTLLVGITIAATVSALGLGGGIIWAPFLILVFGLPVKEMVATSLVVQTIGLGSATVRYSIQKQVNWGLAGKVVLLGVVGLIAGVFLVDFLDQVLFDFALGLLALVIAFFFIYDLDHVKGQQNAPVELKKGFMGMIPFLAMLTSLFSVGIGDYLVPYFKEKMKMPMSVSIATSVAFMFILAGIGAIIMSLAKFNFNWAIILPAGIGVLLGGQLGPKINNYLSENTLKELFTFLLTLIGIHMLYNSI
jgi:uncharacterized membrane protein YfcA